jgi:hypothetical protein
MTFSATLKKICICLLGLFLALIFAGCSSAQKQRKEQREKAAQQSGLWCEFVNGEMFPDIDVALNLEMSKRCDTTKQYTISSYKTPSENHGVLYCCALKEGALKPAPAAKPANKSVKPESKPADKKAADKTDKPETKGSEDSAGDTGGLLD